MKRFIEELISTIGLVILATTVATVVGTILLVVFLMMFQILSGVDVIGEFIRPFLRGLMGL